MSESPQNANGLKQLILVRLLGKAKTPPARSQLNKDLKPFFVVQDIEWQACLDRNLNALQEAGLIEAKPFRLTESGQQAAADFLGLDSAPQAKWDTLRNRYLIARAFDITPSNTQAFQKIGSAEGVRAAVLVKHFQLPGSPVPSESRVKHILAWQQLKTAHDLEIPATSNISHNAILQATILKGQKGDPLKLLSTEATKSLSTDIKHIRQAIIRQWLETIPPETKPQAPTETQPVETTINNGQNANAAHTLDLPRFAASVREVAQTSPTGWFGENKVFLSHVWNQYQGEGGGNGMSRGEFDQLLVEANRQNLLTLSRADLVSAMNPEDVQSSEIQMSNSTFHFLRVDR